MNTKLTPKMTDLLQHIAALGGKTKHTGLDFRTILGLEKRGLLRTEGQIGSDSTCWVILTEDGAKATK